MKKHLFNFMLIVAMVLPIPMMAQNYGHHIVANGTASNQYVPIYGRMCMYMQRTQSVYPASMLTSLQDGTITTLRYYMQTPASVVWSCPFQIKMGTISSTTLTSLASDADFTTVYTGMLDATDTVMTIELDVPFTYTGGNLVVEIANTATVPQMEIMSYNNNKFYGISQTGASWACTNNPTGQARAFLPKVDFLCENIACPKVSTITLDELGATTVAFSWAPVANSAGYLVSINGGDEDYVSDTSFFYDELTPTTSYTVSIRSVCSGGDTSAERSISFTTLCAAVDLPMSEGFEGSDNLPACWTVLYDYTEGGTHGISIGRSGAYAGNNCLTLKAQWGSTQALALATPLIAQPVNTISVEFYAAGEYSSAPTVMAYNSVEVGYVKSLLPNSTFYPVQTITFTQESVYDHYEISFAALEDSDDSVYVVFRRPGDNNVRPVKVDDILIRTASSCFNPQTFSFQSTGDGSVSFVWGDTINTEWEIAYGPSGMGPDTMERAASYISTQPYTITDLSNDTTYDFYLRAICGDVYSYWIGPVTARPNSIEMAKTGTNTITSCGVTIFDNGGGMDDYTSSCNSVLIIYPEGDDQVVRLSGNYFTESNYDFIYLYDGAGTDGLSLGTYSGTGTIDTVSSVGPLTMKFYSDGGTEAEGFQLVVSCEDRAGCVPPYDLEVTNVAVTNAQISWTFNPAFPDPDHYSVAVTNQATGAVTYYAASSSPYSILALQPSTTYSVAVSAICMSGDSSCSTPVTFTTRSLPCAGADLTQEVVDSLYLGSSSSLYLPSWSVYNYGLSQQVYRQEEMDDMGRITGLKFKASAGTSTRLLSFYLGHTTLNSLDGFIMPSDMTLVASGPYMFGANREIEIEFTTPFDYNGSDNLVLTILDNTGSYQAGNYTYCTNIAPYTSVYAATDNNPYNALNPPATASTVTQRMNVIWMGNPCSGHSTCVAPTLSASDILANDVTLSWLSGNTETAWKVEYKETLEEDWITVTESTSNTTYTVSGLTPQTAYSFRVTALCDEGAMASSSVTVTTPCGAYPLPYVENFDNGFIATSSVGNFQPCWNRICSYSYSTYPYLSDAYALSGSHSLYFYSTEYYEAVAVLPIMDAPIDSLVLSFSAFKSGATHDIKVGVMTDPNDFSTFTLVATVSPSATTTWETFEVPFTEYQGTGHYIALACYDKVSYIYVDNILIDTYLPCPRVTGVTIDSATLSTASLHWNASATSYQVQYGPYGFNLGEGTILNVNDTSVLLTGLDNSMRYDVYVRGNCGADGYGHWSFATTIATSCGNLHNIPYYENFDSWMASAALVPMCWNNGGSFGPYLVSAYDYNDGGASLYFSCTSAMPKSFVMLPEMDSQIDISDLELNFAVRGTSGGTLRVGFSPVMGDTTGFVPVETIPITSGNNFIDQLVPLTNYTGTARHLTFIFTKGSGSSASYYLDELTIEPYSACLRPTNLAAAHATDQSVELSWTDNASASQWEVAYCPSTQQFNNSTIQHTIATSNPFTLTGLNPQTSYIFKVRAICGSGDTGYYSNRFGSFTTAQSPAAVPYSYDFENVTEWNEWQTSSSSTQVAWRRGTATAVSGTHAAYITSDHGASPSTIANVVAFTYRDFDFGTEDTNFTLSFKAQVADNGNQTLNYKVFFVDPGQPVFAPSTYYNTPWGALDTITPLITIQPSDTWQDYAVELQHIQGIHRLVFCYNNGNVSASFTTPAQLDDIEIRYTTCPRPEGLQSTTIGSDYATLSWNGPETEYLVTLIQTDNETTQQFTVQGTQVTIDDLVPATYYSASLRKICAPGDTSLVSESISFRTDCLAGPICTYPWIEDFENGLSCWQQEMRRGNNPWQTAGYYENVGHMPPSGATIAYLDHNTEGDSTMLISPVMAISSGAYMTFAHMQMEWSGDQDTLVVLYRSSITDAWHELATYTNSIEDWQTDSLALPNPSDSYQIAFLGCDHYGYGIGLDRIKVVSSDACSSPAVLSRTITHNAITINWGGSASGYEIAIKTVGAPSFPMAQYVNSNTHHFSDLESEMRYVVRLRSVCTDEFSSRWIYDTILTHAVPCTAPHDLAFIESTYNSVTVDWTPTGLEQLWIVQLESSRIGTINDTVSSHPYTFDNLETGDSYFFTVCALCDPESGDQSEWSDTLECSPIDCAPVSDITLGELTDTYLELSWTPGGDESSWKVEYGMPGFSQGLGLGTAIATENPYRLMLSGLQPETDYELYVYARCTETATSVPVGPVAFRTGNIGISGIEGNADINIYPNPTTGSTTISVSGISGKVTIDIVDMNGRTIKSTVQQINDSTKVNVEGLAQGAYFVRIYGEEINSIRKLIVR